MVACSIVYEYSSSFRDGREAERTLINNRVYPRIKKLEKVEITQLVLVTYAENKRSARTRISEWICRHATEQGSSMIVAISFPLRTYATHSSPHSSPYSEPWVHQKGPQQQHMRASRVNTHLQQWSWDLLTPRWCWQYNRQRIFVRVQRHATQKTATAAAAIHINRFLVFALKFCFWTCLLLSYDYICMHDEIKIQQQLLIKSVCRVCFKLCFRTCLLSFTTSHHNRKYSIT